MQCAFHPAQATNVRCHHCGRALCTSCDHRIKGYPFCQECIVAGIEALRRPNYGQQYTQAPQPSASGKSPLLAGLFGLVPGLGAAYNGQPIKALCHFLLPISIWQLASVTHGILSVSSFFGGCALYLFSLYDAWQTAHRARMGADLQAEDARIKNWLQNKIHIWGSLLLVIGGLTLIDQLEPQFTRYAWPGLLILLGAYLLRDYFLRRGNASSAPVQPPAPYHPRPVSFMSTGMTSGLPNNYDASHPSNASNVIQAENRFDRWG